MAKLVVRLKAFVRKYIIPSREISKRPLRERERLLKHLYKTKMGKELDLENPETFTEKIQWMKLYYAHPDLQRCVDKYGFKQYVQEKLGEGYTATLIQVWNSPKEISIRDIPADKFVLKSTLQGDGTFIIPVADKSALDIDKVEKEIKENWFDTRKLLTNSFCSAYYGAKPRVIVETFVEEFANCANDYKLFCFHGEPAFFYVAEDHFKNGENSDVYPITFFDLDWNVMDVSYGEHATNPHVEKPHHLQQMIEIAGKLSQDFAFVRVDFFDTKDKLYLAELTFYPGGGLVHYHPESFDKKMGDMLKLDIKQ